MTNELLMFKIKLAATAYSLGKNKLGNELVDEVSGFNPPWMTTELIHIFKTAKNKLDKRIYAIALKGCAKGSDLEYLMAQWKQGGDKTDNKNKFQFTGYFETGREYLVIDDDIIADEERYRNYVAEAKFSDDTMDTKQFEVFFVLLGTEPQRAFQYALRAQIDALKIDIFLKEGIKLNILSPYSLSRHLLKFLHFQLVEKTQVVWG